MKNYTEVQTNWFINLLFAGMGVFMTWAYLKGWGDNPLTLWPYIVIMPVCCVVPLLLFYRMRTSVDDRNIYISYGVGWIRKTIPLKKIASAGVAEIKWYHGAGIRYTGNETIYSIRLSDGVRIRARGSARNIAIGSRNPQRLCDEIQKRIK